MKTIETRDQLVDALNQAAELEHLLCCAYLYAGFSLRKTPDGEDDPTLSQPQAEITRAWATQLMLVARQEMEHLGMVCNLLSAIGAAPDFARANFPQDKAYYPLEKPFELLPFSMDSLKSFIAFEKPDWVLARNASPQPQDPLLRYHSLQQLYEEIRQAFTLLNTELGPEVLFLGRPEAQITNETLFEQTEKAYQVNLRGILEPDPKARLPEALAMIYQIILEGEGSRQPAPGAQSHYSRFEAIRAQYQAILDDPANSAFEPAKPVACNPRTFHHPTGGTGELITNPFTLEVANLFNLVYESMMLLLIRFYGHTDETPEECKALQEIAFFPMMTMGIRPLGELLMDLPMCEQDTGTMAGPPFEIMRPLHFLPNKKAAWVILQELLDRTGHEAQLLAGAAIEQAPKVAERMEFISKSLVRNARNFRDFIKG